MRKDVLLAMNSVAPVIKIVLLPKNSIMLPKSIYFVVQIKISINRNNEINTKGSNLYIKGKQGLCTIRVFKF